MSDESETTAEPAEREPGLIGRLLARLLRHKIRILLVGGALVGLSLGGVALMSFLGSEVVVETPTAERALELMEEGDFDAAKQVAGRLATRSDLKFDEQGVPAYVFGRALVSEADGEWSEKRRQALYLIAARYLQEADAKGFPEGHHNQGLYHLGRSLFHAGLQTQSLPTLLKALELDPDHRAELQLMLARVYEADPELESQQALDYVEEYLSNRALTADERTEGQLLQARVLIGMGEYDRAEGSLEAALSKTGPEDEHATELHLEYGKFWLGKASFLRQNALKTGLEADHNEADLAIEQARLHFQEAERSGERRGESRYYLAICYQRMGDLKQAAMRFADVRREFVDSPVSIAAALAEAESLQIDGDDEESCKRFVNVLRIAAAYPTIDSEWMTAEEFEQRVVEAQLDFRASGRFDLALALAKEMWPPLPRDMAVQLQAETNEQWGQLLLNQEAGPGESEAELRVRGRERLREAAQGYYSLSRLRLSSREYLDYVWQAAESFFQGRDYERAVTLYRQYLDEPPSTRMARALLRIGESLVAIGNQEDAIATLKKAIELYPDDPDTYHARLIASQIHVERHELQLAKDLLLENLESGLLTPESSEWRDSLFALGRTMYREALALETESRQLGVDSNDPDAVDTGLDKLEEAYEGFDSAIERLAEAVFRYRDDPAAIEAKYLLAESYRQAAKFPRKRLKVVTINGVRFQLRNQIAVNLSQAYDLYDELERSLTLAQDQRTLSELETRILRNASFAKADVLFDMGDYRDAIKVYKSISNRYSNRPESLEAFCRIASCHRQLQEPDQAIGILEQAKLFLQDRIPSDSDFTTTTRYTRDQWVSYLDWLITL